MPPRPESVPSPSALARGAHSPVLSDCHPDTTQMSHLKQRGRLKSKPKLREGWDGTRSRLHGPALPNARGEDGSWPVHSVCHPGTDDRTARVGVGASQPGSVTGGTGRDFGPQGAAFPQLRSKRCARVSQRRQPRVERWGAGRDGHGSGRPPGNGREEAARTGRGRAAPHPASVNLLLVFLAPGRGRPDDTQVPPTPPDNRILSGVAARA